MVPALRTMNQPYVAMTPVSRRNLLGQTRRSEKAFTGPGLYLLFRNPTGAAAAPSPIHGDLVRLCEGEQFL